MRGEYEAAEAFHFAYDAMPLLASFAVFMATRRAGLRTPILVSGVADALGLAGFVFLGSWTTRACSMVAKFVATIELILLESLPPGKRSHG